MPKHHNGYETVSVIGEVCGLLVADLNGEPNYTPFNQDVYVYTLDMNLPEVVNSRRDGSWMNNLLLDYVFPWEDYIVRHRVDFNVLAVIAKPSSTIHGAAMRRHIADYKEICFTPVWWLDKGVSLAVAGDLYAALFTSVGLTYKCEWDTFRLVGVSTDSQTPKPDVTRRSLPASVNSCEPKVESNKPQPSVACKTPGP